MPLASVIIPTYNYARFIRDAIESVLEQGYDDGEVEIIVVDDGSTDNTFSQLEPYIKDGLITYIYQSNQGKAAATATGIDESSGTYIFNLDADDYFLPGKIGAVVQIFEQHPEVVHVGSPALVRNEKTGQTSTEQLPVSITGKPVDGSMLLRFLYENNIFFGGGSTYAAKASALKKLKIPRGVDMYIDEFLVVALLPFGSSYFLPRALSVWRVHQSNFSGEASKQKKTVREERLLLSSGAMLTYLERNVSDRYLLRLYRLQHATRRVAFRERINSKSPADIAGYAIEVFFRIRPGWQVIRNYNVVNRLIPSSMLRLLRSLRAQVQLGAETLSPLTSPKATD
jgi:glycosyltransferase involved in cell wall biosynthesis